MPSIPIPEDAATRRMVVVAVANQKGGVGKTTMAALLAQEAAARGLRAMAIDLDPQGNLTRHLHPAPVRTGVARMLYEKAALESVLCDAGGVSLAAAHAAAAVKVSASVSAIAIIFFMMVASIQSLVRWGTCIVYNRLCRMSSIKCINIQLFSAYPNE